MLFSIKKKYIPFKYWNSYNRDNERRIFLRLRLTKYQGGRCNKNYQNTSNSFFTMRKWNQYLKCNEHFKLKVTLLKKIYTIQKIYSHPLYYSTLYRFQQFWWLFPPKNLEFCLFSKFKWPNVRYHLMKCSLLI